MSLGDSRTATNEKKTFYEKQYNSRFSFRDYQHNTNKVLNFSYKNGMLIIAIEKIRDGGFEYETLVDAWITPAKAKLLAQAIKAFREEKKHSPSVGYGISSGMGETQRAFILHGDSDGNPVVTIGKFNGNTGDWIVTEDFQFNNQDFHCYLNWSNIKDNTTAEKRYDNSLEFDMLEQVVNNFANAMDGAFAYSAADLMKFDIRGIYTKMDPIYDKLGIERKFSGGANRSIGNFFGNNNNNQRNFGSSEHRSLDDITSRFEDDDE